MSPERRPELTERSVRTNLARECSEICNDSEWITAPTAKAAKLPEAKLVILPDEHELSIYKNGSGFIMLYKKSSYGAMKELPTVGLVTELWIGVQAKRLEIRAANPSQPKGEIQPPKEWLEFIANLTTEMSSVKSETWWSRSRAQYLEACQVYNDSTATRKRRQLALVKKKESKQAMDELFPGRAV